jgi:hypothetical protein
LRRGRIRRGSLPAGRQGFGPLRRSIQRGEETEVSRLDRGRILGGVPARLATPASNALRSNAGWRSVSGGETPPKAIASNSEVPCPRAI